MQDVSDRWEGAVRGGSAAARVKSKVEVYSYAGVLLASTEKAVGVYPPLQLQDGTVTVDGSAPIRRSAQLTFLDTAEGDFAPDSGSALLANEAGNEVRIWTGFKYLDGTEELMAQGVFGFADDDTQSPMGDQTIAVQLYDRSRRIKRNRFVNPYVIAAGSNYVTALEAMLRSRWADVRIESVPTIFTTPKLTFDEQDDPWEKAQDMAAKIGYECYFDVDGVLQIVPILAPSPASPIAFDYSEGAQATILGISRRASNEQGFNGVIMTGASSTNGTPPRGEAWDTDPSSATYSGYDAGTKTFGPSPYGAVPKFVSSSLLTTSAQCAAAAQAELLNTIGRHEIIQFDTLPNPAHEPRDLVTVKRAKAKIDAVYELQSFNVPLRLGTMTALTKERRVA